jgi:hypothetical protein
MYNNLYTKNKDLHTYNTRHSEDFHINTCKTTLAYNTIKVQGALLWNNLDPSLKLIYSSHAFKNTFKHTLIDEYEHF